MSVQDLGLKCGHRHALAVDRVEAAHGVTQDGKSVRERRYPVIAVADGHGMAIPGRIVNRFGEADQLCEIGQRGIGSESAEAVGVRWWVVTENSHEGDETAAAFDQ
jgi:hypothetical protein